MHRCNRLRWTADHHTQTEASTSKWTAGRRKERVPVTVSAAPVAARARTRAGEKRTDRLWADRMHAESHKTVVTEKSASWFLNRGVHQIHSMQAPYGIWVISPQLGEILKHYNEQFIWSSHSAFQQVQSRHIPSFSQSAVLIWRNGGEYVNFVFSLLCPWLRFQPAPLWSSHCLETLPRDPPCILERRAPIRNGAHPNWHLRGRGRLACSWVPAAVLRACTPGRASIIHCLLFINNPPPPRPSPLLARTHLPRCPAALCSTHHDVHIYIFIFHTPSFIILTFPIDFGASSPRLWAMWASVPSVQYVEVTACLTCHCQRNKGVRYDTCPCYTPLCIFNVSAIPSGQKSVSDKSHAMENKFWTLPRSLL